MAKTYVIAGNCREFECWCREKMVSPHSPLVCYVSGPEKLQGLRNPDIVSYGTYYERSDYQELNYIVRHICRPVEPKIVYVEVPPKKPSFIPYGPRVVSWQ